MMLPAVENIAATLVVCKCSATPKGAAELRAFSPLIAPTARQRECSTHSLMAQETV